MQLIGPPPLDGQGFRRHLDDFDLGVRTLCALVIDGIPRATEAFVSGDDTVCRSMLADHDGVKSLPHDIEAAVGIDIARRSPVGSDLRFLVTVLRVAPALGRCLELIDHIATRRWVGPLLPRDAVSAFTDLGRTATGMWETAVGAWCEAKEPALMDLVEIDGALDDAVLALPGLLRHPALTPLAAMQAVTVGRFYERLGAHAVDFAKRTRWYATGE